MSKAKPPNSSSHIEEKPIGLNIQTNPQDLTKYSHAITPLITTTLQIHPACLEFAPANISHEYPESLRIEAREYFVVGTYQLAEELDEEDKEKNEERSSDDKHQKRIGGISLFRFQNHRTELYHIQDIFHPYGIYDLKFLPYHPIFAASTTTGRIVIFQFSSSTTLSSSSTQSTLQITHLATHLIFPSEPIIISITWYPLQHPDDTTRILALTVENGGVYLIRFNSSFSSFERLNNGEAVHEHVFKTPFFENKERVWCCAFSPRSLGSTIVCSGGDDNHFRSSTLILPPEVEKLGDCNRTDELVSSSSDGIAEGIKQTFPAGITSILALPLPTSSPHTNSQLLLIGSYDNNIYLCTLSTSHSTLTTHLHRNLNGGVYRLKLLSSSSSPSPSPPPPPSSDPNTPNANIDFNFKVLACCMHAGTKILHVRKPGDEDWKIDVLAEVNDNESMCYAADVQKLPVSVEDGTDSNGEEEEGGRICVSSSWADSTLSIWKYTADFI